MLINQHLCKNKENFHSSDPKQILIWYFLPISARFPIFTALFGLKVADNIELWNTYQYQNLLKNTAVQKEQSGSRRGGNVLQMRTKSRPPRGHIMKGSKSSDQFSCSVVSDSLWPHGLQHSRLPCPLPTPGAYSNSCPSSWWCHPTISSSVIPFSFCLQSFPASRSFPVSQFFPSGGQSIGTSTSASVLPMNIQDWFPLGLTDLISLLSKGLSRVFYSTTIQKHQFFSIQLSL